MMFIEIDPSSNEDYLYWCSCEKQRPLLQNKKLSITIDDNKSILVGSNVGYKSSILHVLDWWFRTNNPNSRRIQTIGLTTKRNGMEYDFNSWHYEDDQAYVQDVYRLLDSYFMDEDGVLSPEKPKTWYNVDYTYLSVGTFCLLRTILSAYFPPNKQKCFMLVDDIESHLSVEWQERILKDIDASPYVEGFVVTTHSPFIFSNEFRKYAHGTGRFLMDKE